ncbi:hypothetical protein QPK87_31875 [Kamptonema cortianum]|nr:hypothetical protein [Kamptonema cortianum]
MLNSLNESLETFLERLSNLFDPSVTALVSVIDILLVAYVVYRLLKLVRGRRAWRVVLGIGVFVLALAGSEKLGLRTLHWILDKATIFGSGCPGYLVFAGVTAGH